MVGERTIYLDCDVLQADGGTRTAAITGAFVALKLAVGTLVEDGLLKEDPIVQSVAAVSVGIVDDEVLLDLCYEEDVRAATDMNVAMDGDGGFIEIQGTAEARSFSRKESNEMLDVAAGGIKKLLDSQIRFLNA
jgi:ribonuclease PH